MSDGGLRQIFRKHLPEFDWLSVETWSTGRGVPDLNYCCAGIEGWIECKATRAWRVAINPEQVAWAERRARHGGRTCVAVRRYAPAGPRKEAFDELWLFRPDVLRHLLDERMDKAKASLITLGGPANWSWAMIRAFLLK